MLYRKIEEKIEQFLKEEQTKILLIDGARQVGKTYSITRVGSQLFKNFIYLNMVEDSQQNRLFENVSTVEDFYFRTSSLFGNKMGKKEDTLIFIDEIQTYPQLLTLLKFLNQDNRFTFIASGSLLGVTLSLTSSIPMGSISIVRMYPLDFEEFLMANGFNKYAIDVLRDKFTNNVSLDIAMHNRILDLYKKYLLIGGLPEAVKTFIETQNIDKVRFIHNEIHDFYKIDASKYGEENKLKIETIYNMLPSLMENKKKRIVAKSIENKKGKTLDNYQDEFDYLISSGIATEVNAISNPSFPLIETAQKNLIKLYLNDVGLLTNILYKNNIQAVLEDFCTVNLGSVYETAVANELKAHGYKTFYYDNRAKGEVDFLIDDYSQLSIIPIEVKSGRDYSIHKALDRFISNPDYKIQKAIVLSNEREIKVEGKILYLPIYFTIFI